MDSLYQENILDHFKHPRNFGEPTTYTSKTDGSNPSCGDDLTLYLTVLDELITDASFTGVGCAISTAATSMLLIEIKGKSIADVAAMSEQSVYGMLGVIVGPEREKCALLAWKTLQKALQTVNLQSHA